MLSNMSKKVYFHVLRTTLRKKEKLATGERELIFSKRQVLQTYQLTIPCE